jgi:hypothetical protein
MSQRITLALILLCTLALLASCGGSTTPAAPGDSGTLLAQTAEAMLTATAAPKVTPTATVPPIVPPTQTPNVPAPAPTAQPAPCTNDSKFVSDITVPDGTHYAPGTPFDKTWRIQNTGTCTWDTTYQFRLIGGEALAGQNFNLPQTVAPNATVDITVKLVSPMTAGKYRGQWRIHAPDGSPFGQKPYVDIVVP